MSVFDNAPLRTRIKVSSVEANHFLTTFMSKRVVAAVAIPMLVAVGLIWFVATRPGVPQEPTSVVSPTPPIASSSPQSATTIEAATTTPGPSENLMASSTVEILDWKTYRNEKYGFLLSYPVNFQLGKFPDNCDSVTARHLQIQDPVPCFGVHIFDPSAKLDYLTLTVARTNHSLAEFVAQKQTETEITSSLIAAQRTINGINGFEIYGNGGEGPDYEDTFAFKKGELLIMISLDPIFDGKLKEANSSSCCNDYGAPRDIGIYSNIVARINSLP